MSGLQWVTVAEHNSWAILILKTPLFSSSLGLPIPFYWALKVRRRGLQAMRWIMPVILYKDEESNDFMVEYLRVMS